MHRRTPIALAVAAALGLCAAAPLHAQTGKTELQQAAQALGPALNALAAKTGARLLYSPEAVKGKQAPALAGSLSAEDALSRLLAGTGLTWTRSADGAYAIKAATAEKVAELAAIEVKAETEKGYVVKRASTASKTDTPLMETPFSIQVVPREVVDDQLSSNLKDALRNVSGVSPIGDRHYDGVALRGFEADGVTAVYRNGLRIRRAQNDLANVENVEVLKGPAGALYGRIEPGGLVNLVTKRPQDSSQYSVKQEVGSFGHLKTVGDATGALNADRTLLYRIVGSYLNEDTFVDKAFAERSLIAPSLTWRPNAQTEVNLNYEKQHEKSQYWAGIPMVNGRPADIPVRTNLGFGESKDKEYQVMDREIFGFDWSHKFSDDWKITHRFHNVTGRPSAYFHSRAR